MSDQRLTQCPHCKASFKVSEEQLSAANGRVRCGACMNIFDAIAYSLSNSESHKSDSFTLPNEANPSTQDSDATMDFSEVGNFEEELNESSELFADNPEEDVNDPGYSGNLSHKDEFSTSFLELDSETPSDPYSTSFQEIDDGFITDTDSEAIDESWTQDILDDINDEKKSDKVEPSFSGTFEQQPTSTYEESTPEESFSHSELDFNEVNHYKNAEFQYEQDKPSHRHWFVSLLFVLANLALIILLLGQAIWFHYEKLAKYPHVKEYYQLACQHLSCTLPKLENISKIKSNNLVVRSHPTQRKALIIDTVIVNQATYDQAFPNLALYFSDINKNIVAQRLFKPNEYLTGDLASWKEMPSQQPIHISLEIVDPGKQAVNYNLKFFSSNP